MVFSTLICLILLSVTSCAQNTDWKYYAGDAASKRYIDGNQINPESFHRLQTAWRYTAPDKEIASAFGFGHGANKGTPLKISNKLYYGSPLGVLCAIDAETGEELWSFDPRVWEERPSFLGNSRGIAYWSDGRVERIFYGTANDRLYSINVINGELDVEFGEGGFVDLLQGSDRPQDPDITGVTSPPIVCAGVVVVGSAMYDIRRRLPPTHMPPGDVRGYDVRNGSLKWTFHTIPRKGEYGVETWEGNSNEYFGAANVWAAMSADTTLGYVYLPVSTPSQDFYGGGRLGDNLFGDSLVCLKAATGERAWHYQLIHHGLWDYDPPAPPVLMDVTIDDKLRRIVAQVTKQGFCYVFDRENGKPIWPIEERTVPASTVPGERASKTQPFPTKPAAFDLQGLSEEDLIDFTDELRNEAIAIVNKFDSGALYTPPSEHGTIVIPGLLGGADWAGASFHPLRKILFIPSKTLPSVVRLKPAKRPGPEQYTTRTREPLRGPHGLPLTKPPYGRITAIDMSTGEHKWVKPIGRGPTDHPKLVDMDLNDIGWSTRIFVATLPNLVIAAFHTTLCAYDLETGDKIAEINLPLEVNGNMMSYMEGGHQYIVLPIGGSGRPPQLIALALKK
ncbi:MAG: PQQ-binding-like beta-propeller repeat protein [Candidatus Latescibacterota bacterium]|nr:PQQ-binding-like beta-propeller repeat protein [Candidatus Latescibacterota bacterium]